MHRPIDAEGLSALIGAAEQQIDGAPRAASRAHHPMTGVAGINEEPSHLGCTYEGAAIGRVFILTSRQMPGWQTRAPHVAPEGGKERKGAWRGWIEEGVCVAIDRKSTRLNSSHT